MSPLCLAPPAFEGVAEAAALVPVPESVLVGVAMPPAASVELVLEELELLVLEPLVLEPLVLELPVVEPLEPLLALDCSRPRQESYFR